MYTPETRKMGWQADKGNRVCETSHVGHFKIWESETRQQESSSRWLLRSAGSFRAVITGAQHRRQWFSSKPPVTHTKKEQNCTVWEQRADNYKHSWYIQNYFLTFTIVPCPNTVPILNAFFLNVFYNWNPNLISKGFMISSVLNFEFNLFLTLSNKSNN